MLEYILGYQQTISIVGVVKKEKIPYSEFEFVETDIQHISSLDLWSAVSTNNNPILSNILNIPRAEDMLARKN